MLHSSYNENPYIITADTWDKAVLLCKELYSDKDKIRNIINSNNKWFQKKILSVRIVLSHFKVSKM